MNSITVCTDGRDIVESADKGVKVFDTGQFDFYFVGVALVEFVVLLSDSFTVVPKSWAYVVQSTKCFVLKWETACRSSTCVVRSFFFYLDTDVVDNLFRVPLCYLFRRRTLFAYVTLHGISGNKVNARTRHVITRSHANGMTRLPCGYAHKNNWYWEARS